MPLDDEPTFRADPHHPHPRLFQIESPGQRELVGKFGPEPFDDLIIDISLFRPGPVKSDMITPFLNARQGWSERRFLHPTPRSRRSRRPRASSSSTSRCCSSSPRPPGSPWPRPTRCAARMGTPHGPDRGRGVVAARGARPAATPPTTVDRIWEVLKAFASFGFCKAHAAAFALPTYQSAWLKTHHPAAFLAGVLTHDPGMYPKRLHPRRRPLASASRCSASTSTPRATPTASSGSTRRMPDADRRSRIRATPTRRPRRADPDAGLPAWQRAASPTASGSRSPTSRGSARPRSPGSSPGSPTPPRRLLDTAPTCQPPGHRAARARRGFDAPARHGPAAGSAGAAGSPGATCCCTSPSSTGGRARRRRARRRAAAGGSPSRASRRRARWRGSGSTSATPGAPRSRRRPARSCRRAEQPTQLTLDLGDTPAARRGDRAARDDRPGAGARRARRARPRRERPRRRLLRARCSTRSG